jgi:CubicO group peptidase (beta-lactamase class C family)
MSKTESPSNQNISRRDFLCGSAALWAGISTPGHAPAFGREGVSPKTDYSPVFEKIKQTFPAAMAQKDITGAAIALVDGEQIVWSEGFGYTDRSRSVKVTGDTLFHAGSISKSFTALGILKAVDKGLLALDDAIKKHLPWFSPNSLFGAAETERITLRHLLSHHSGLGTWPPLGNPSDEHYHTRTFEQVVKSMNDSWLKSPAGERFEYSNQGFDLAGYGLEVASGKSFADFMRDEILAPLGMTVSTFNQVGATRKDTCARGYLGKRPVPIVNDIVLPLIAAGGLFVSANDLARLIIFHFQGGMPNGKQVVPQRLLQEMYTPQLSARGQSGGYGLGIYKAIQHDTTRLSHGGHGFGISTHYRLLPEHKIGVVLLTNQDVAHHAPDLAGHVIELMLTAKLGALPKNKPVITSGMAVVSPDEAALKRLEGTYLLSEGILFHFKYEKGGLFHIVGGERQKLDAYSPTDFTRRGRRYKFTLNDNGRPKGVQILDSDYDPQTAENSVIRLSVNDTPADERGPNKPEWSRLVGKYSGTFIGGGSQIKVSVKNGHLYLNDGLKMTEVRPDLFVTADGEAIIFKGEQLSVGNKLYSKR